MLIYAVICASVSLSVSVLYPTGHIFLHAHFKFCAHVPIYKDTR